MPDAQVDEESLAAFLGRLAGRTPVPASGAVAALCTAQAAALVAMVARYGEVGTVVERAEALLTRARDLLTEDEQAFATVVATWDDPRRETADAAMLGASEPQAQVVETADRVLALVDRLRPGVRPAIRPDLDAAGHAAAAGSTIARTNVESNLRSLPDSEERSRLLRRAGVADHPKENR